MSRGRYVCALLALCAAAAVVFLMAGAERASAQTEPETPVNIPDANMRGVLLSILGNPPGGITRGHMRSLGPTLDLSGREIRDLTGLEYATNVWRLFLSRGSQAGTGTRYNYISDLTPLAGLTRLQVLDLKYNRITDLSPLARLSNLATLDLEYNRITSLTGLEGKPLLRRLLLDDNRITDLSPLARLNLTSLSLNNNQITDLSPLAALTGIEFLFLEGNSELVDISPLRRLTTIISLSLARNEKIRDLTPLNGFSSLEYLYLWAMGIENISPLAATSVFASGATLNIRYNSNLNTGIEPNAGAIAALRARGIRVLTSTASGTMRGVSVTPEVGQLKVDWTPLPSFDPQGYRVQWHPDTEYSFTSARQFIADGASTKTATIGITTPPGNEKLTPGDVYWVRVRAHKPGTYSPPSYRLCGVPMAEIDSVGGVTVAQTPGSEKESLTVSWSLADGAADYKVQWKSGDQVYDEVRQDLAGGDDKTKYVIAGLEAGTEYAVRVISVRSEPDCGPAHPDGEPSAEAVGETELGTVESVTATPGVESLTVRWRPAAGAADYKVQWKSGDQDYDEARQAHAGGADKMEYIIADLEAGTEYTVRVIPVRSEGPDGEPSAKATGTPLAPDEEKPNPVDVRVDAGLNRLTVSWSEVTGATGYRVQWRQTETLDFAAGDSDRVGARESGGSFGCKESGAADATPDSAHDIYVYVICNLEPDVQYTVRVTPMPDDAPFSEPGDGTGTPFRGVVISFAAGPDGVGVGSATAVEGEDAELTLRLDAPTRARVTVRWTTEDDTAKAGEDYREMSDRRLTFPPGAVSATLRVPTLQDRQVEPEETFRVRLTETETEYATLDPDPDAASATVTIADDDTAPARVRALDTVLAGMGRWIAADAVDVVEDRFAGRRETEAQVSLGGRTFSLPGIGSQGPASSAAPAEGFGHDFDRDRDRYEPAAEPSVPALSAASVSGSRFNLPLGMDEGAAAGAPGWRFWGAGTAGGFDSNSEPGLRVDGDIVGGYVGVDGPVNPDALLGVALAHGRSDIDYSIDDVTTGAVDLELTSVLPYGRWEPEPGLGVWGLLGAGWGDLELKDEAGEVETSVAMRMAAAGVRRDMATWRDVDLAVKADGFVARLESAAAKGLPKAAGASRRLRLSLEGAMQRAVSPVSRVTPSVEVGGRWDDGDAETGMGVEFGGGLAFEHDTLGLSVEARGRALLTHSESLREWGMSLSGTMDPGVTGRGPWMTFAPGWGVESSRVSQIWDSKGVFRAYDDAGEAPEFLPGRLNMKVGWGLPTLDGQGRLTPWAGLSMAESEMQDYILGARMEVGRLMSLSLENRRSSAGDHRLMLFGRLHW